jgi:hypothetical protein
LSSFEVPSKSVSVSIAVSLGDDEVGHCPPDGLAARPPEDAHGAIVPIEHDAVGPHDNDRIKSSFQDQPQRVSVLRQAGDVGFASAMSDTVATKLDQVPAGRWDDVFLWLLGQADGLGMRQRARRRRPARPEIIGRRAN